MASAGDKSASQNNNCAQRPTDQNDGPTNNDEEQTDKSWGLGKENVRLALFLTPKMFQHS
jgi:hypothetical protein